MANIYPNTIGLVIDIDLGEAITGATGISIKVKKPDGSEVSWVPTISGTQILRYVTVSGDLSLAGNYILQPLLTIGSWTGRAIPVSFSVYGLYGGAVAAS